MPVETIPIPVESRFGVTVYNQLLAHEPRSDRVLLMLPGRGYTCNHPVLAYLRRAAVGLGYDVLSVEYGFQVVNADVNAAGMPLIQEDVDAAVGPVLARGYRKVCVAGKSLGTPLAAMLARRIEAESISTLMLTPIGGALHGLEGVPTLAIIGTADGVYAPEVVAAFDSHPTIRWKVFDGLNHSLEVKGDWRASLAVLPQIIETCETFLARED